MQPITKIFIVRHGESIANRDDICGGDTDLTDTGIKQAETARRMLKGFKFDEVYSSDYIRAIDTAEIISGVPVAKTHQLPELRESFFGKLENQPLDEWLRIKDEWESKYQHLPFSERSHYDFADYIESDAVLCERVMEGLEKIAKANRGQTVMAVSSAGPVRVLLMHLGFAEFLTVGSFKNTGYIELDYDGEKFWIQKVVGVQKPDPTRPSG